MELAALHRQRRREALAKTWAEGNAICQAVRTCGRSGKRGAGSGQRSQFRQACELVQTENRQGATVEVGLPGGLSDFDGLRHLDQPVPPPRQLDYDRWLGPAPVAPYCPARVHKTWRWNWITAAACDGRSAITSTPRTGAWGWTTRGDRSKGHGEYTLASRVWDAPSKFRVTARTQRPAMIISGSYDGVPGARWVGDGGWIWVDRSRIEAQPRQVLFSRIRPDEIRFEPSQSHYKNFLDCVRTRRRTLSPADVALRSTTPGYLGLISILSRTKIHWDPDRQRIMDNPLAERLLSRPMRSPWHLG
jgi:hypothetical protein